MDQPKIERVLRLMKLMTGNTDYTIDEIAEKLDLSRRSIYRYIETFKDAGFVIIHKNGGIYKLGRESRYFRDISQLIHFTDEEAHIVNQLIEGLDNTNILKQNLRKKLSSVYNCTSMADCVVDRANSVNTNAIIEAITTKQQVILHNYSSSHTDRVSDRLVEPFGFTTNYVQIWCYEPDSQLNKLFNTARIEKVEILNKEWEYEEHHRKGYIDIFRISGYEQHRVQLILGVLSYNLLTEEYPLSTRDIHRIDNNHWKLDTLVSNYVGIGRFVMGLYSDITIITPEFQEYLNQIIRERYNSIKE